MNLIEISNKKILCIKGLSFKLDFYHPTRHFKFSGHYCDSQHAKFCPGSNEVAGCKRRHGETHVVDSKVFCCKLKILPVMIEC